VEEKEKDKWEEAEEALLDIFEESVGEILGPVAKLLYHERVRPKAKSKKKKKQRSPQPLKATIGDMLKAKEKEDESNE
jgi:hypothetical protein